jgi:hypothetical protein
VLFGCYAHGTPTRDSDVDLLVILRFRGSDSRHAMEILCVWTACSSSGLKTWNFAHINNPFTRMRIRHALEAAGYVASEICSPDELLGGQS